MGLPLTYLSPPQYVPLSQLYLLSIFFPFFPTAAVLPDILKRDSHIIFSVTTNKEEAIVQPELNCWELSSVTSVSSGLMLIYFTHYLDGGFSAKNRDV